MKNWRLLESEIERILHNNSVDLDRNHEGDLIISTFGGPILNVTEFAKELAERVEIKATATQVKT